MRSCAICRKRACKAELWPLKGVAALCDAAPLGGRSPRRGAHICLTAACLTDYLLRRGGARQRAEAQARVHQVAQQRLLELLGLARRCGLLVHGVERVGQQSEELFVVVADDGAKRSQRRLAEAKVFVEARAMGDATGLPGVVALGIRPSRLCLQAASWFGVWYDTRTAMLANINSQSAIEVAR
ncbi:MAG: hypothetical protein EOO40_01525 [Deltaproteobacteria bacterium]|nr:MAG: hypothetical protein EOO40_01525 [Deltaproteobacteria bacterium]